MFLSQGFPLGLMYINTVREVAQLVSVEVVAGKVIVWCYNKPKLGQQCHYLFRFEYDLGDVGLWGSLGRDLSLLVLGRIPSNYVEFMGPRWAEMAVLMGVSVEVLVARDCL